MKLWLISQTENMDYDTYDSAVVTAETEAIARCMSPAPWDEGKVMTQEQWEERGWCSSSARVSVKYLGAAEGLPQSVICASYNAG